MLYHSIQYIEIIINILIINDLTFAKPLISDDFVFFFFNFLLFLRVKIVASCDMILRHFPMDTQQCLLTLGSCRFMTDKRENNIAGGPNLAGKVSYPEPEQKGK